MFQQFKPLTFLGPMLIAYVVAAASAAGARGVEILRTLPTSSRAVSRKRQIFSEQTLEKIYSACLTEGLFMGNIAYAVWAMTLESEANSEMRVGAVMLMAGSIFFLPFSDLLTPRRKRWVAFGSLLLAAWILYQYRICSGSPAAPIP